jgi:hypothetical protein
MPKTLTKADFDERYIPEPMSGCWIWLNRLDRNGYGFFRGVTASRASYLFHKGPLPDGHEIDHLCRLRCCVNPDHLEAVTHSTNVLRSDHRCRRQTHCINGHEFNLENTYISKKNKRMCRECSKLRMRRRRA